MTDWKPIESAPLPTPSGKPQEYVLVRGLSGMRGIKYFICIAFRVEGWHQGEWNDVLNDRLSDCGWWPTEWMLVPEGWLE